MKCNRKGVIYGKHYLPTHSGGYSPQRRRWLLTKTRTFSFLLLYNFCSNHLALGLSMIVKIAPQTYPPILWIKNSTVPPLSSSTFFTIRYSWGIPHLKEFYERPLLAGKRQFKLMPPAHFWSFNRNWLIRNKALSIGLVRATHRRMQSLLIVLVKLHYYQQTINLGYLSAMTCQNPKLQSITTTIFHSLGAEFTTEDTIFSPYPFTDDVME